MSGPRPESGTEPRELSAFDIGCVVVGGIIGVGIFFTPQKVAAAVDTPGQVMLAWGLGGLLAVLGAIVFAELALAVPGHGGMYRYVRRAFGDIPAFLYGWSNWLIVQAGAAGIVGLLLANYLEKAIAPAGPWSAPAKVFVAAGAIAVFTALNVLGLRTGKRVQNTLTVLKVLALAGLVGVAWFAPAPAPAPAAAAVPEPSDRSTLGMLGAAILPVLFATGGWQQGSFVAGAARRPWSVAFGMLFGVAVVVLTYMSVNVAYLDLLGFEGARASSAIGADAAAAALGDIGGRVLAAIVVVSAAGILNTICLAPPYVLYAMAQEGCFPAAFGRLHPRFGTPVLGVLGQGVWAIVLVIGVHFGLAAVQRLWQGADGEGGAAAAGHHPGAIDTLDFVCSGVVYVDWLFFALCGIAALRLRPATGSARLPAPVATGAAVVFTLGAAAVTVAAFYARTSASLVGTFVVVAGLAFARRGKVRTS